MGNTPPSPSQSAVSANPPAGSGTHTCPKKTHWVQISLNRLTDQAERPKWWPTKTAPPYKAEPYSAISPTGPQDGSLDGGGSMRLDDIPEGSCQIHFHSFYQEIEQHFTKEIGA